MLSVLSWIVCGLIVGLLARALVPGRQNLGGTMTAAVSVAGAYVGGVISTALWPEWVYQPEVNQMWPGWLMATLGAVVSLWGYVVLTRPRTELPSRA